MKKPKISIVLPVYNMEQYLDGTISCLVNQTLEDIEIICVDDGSTDSSMEVLRDWEKRDPRITVHGFGGNQSTWVARKWGIEHAAGKYLLFVDADDTLESCACQELYEEMERQPADILHFGSNIINADDLPWERIHNMERFVEPYMGTLSGEDIFTACFEKNLYTFNLWNKLFSTELCKRSLENTEAWYLPKAQDKLLYWILSLKAESYRGIPKKYYNYYFGRGGTGHNRLTLKQFERYCTEADTARVMHDYLVQQGLAEKYSHIDRRSKDSLMEDCSSAFKNELSREDRATAFDVMIRKWGAADTVSALANKYWKEHYELATMLQSAASLRYDGRKPGCIAAYYHSCANGGVQRVMCQLAALWHTMGYEIVVITDEAPTEQDYALPEGVKRAVVPDARTLPPSDYSSRAEALEKVLREYHVDVMVHHAWENDLLLWDVMLCKANGVAVVCHTHNIFSMPMRTGHGDMYSLRAPYLLADVVVTLSEADQYYWQHFNNNVFETINPFTDNIADWHYSAALDQRKILWVGRFSEEKRPLDALKIMQSVVKRVPDAHLHIVGEGKTPVCAEEMKKYLADNGLTEHVTMHGFQLNVRPYYENASVFLMTSDYEGYPLTLQESKMAGLPAVMYDLPYLTLSKGRRGMVCVEGKNTEAAADAIVDILLDDAKRHRMAQEARAHVEALYTFDFASKWTEIFDSIGKDHESAVPEASKIMLETLFCHNSVGIDAWEEKTRHLETLTGSLAVLKKKIGRAFTLLPRAIRGFLRVWKCYGGHHAVNTYVQKLRHKLHIHR